MPIEETRQLWSDFKQRCQDVAPQLLRLALASGASQRFGGRSGLAKIAHDGFWAKVDISSSFDESWLLQSQLKNEFRAWNALNRHLFSEFPTLGLEIDPLQPSLCCLVQVSGYLMLIFPELPVASSHTLISGTADGGCTIRSSTSLSVGMWSAYLGAVLQLKPHTVYSRPTSCPTLSTDLQLFSSQHTTTLPADCEIHRISNTLILIDGERLLPPQPPVYAIRSTEISIGPYIEQHRSALSPQLEWPLRSLNASIDRNSTDRKRDPRLLSLRRFRPELQFLWPCNPDAMTSFASHTLEDDQFDIKHQYDQLVVLQLPQLVQRILARPEHFLPAEFTSTSTAAPHLAGSTLPKSRISEFLHAHGAHCRHIPSIVANLPSLPESSSKSWSVTDRCVALWWCELIIRLVKYRVRFAQRFSSNFTANHQDFSALCSSLLHLPYSTQSFASLLIVDCADRYFSPSSGDDTIFRHLHSGFTAALQLFSPDFFVDSTFCSASLVSYVHRRILSATQDSYEMVEVSTALWNLTWTLAHSIFRFRRLRAATQPCLIQ